MAGSSRGAPGGTPRPPEAGLLLAGDVDGVGLVPRLGVARFQFAELRFDGLAGEPGLSVLVTMSIHSRMTGSVSLSASA